MAALRNVSSYRATGLLATAGPAADKAPTCWLLVGVGNAKHQRHQGPSIGVRCHGGYHVVQ
jgi:hypothetical protein